MIASPNYARLVYDGDGSERRRHRRPGRLGHGRGRVQALLRAARHGHASRIRSTAARTTSASSTAASPRAASSPAPRRRRRRSRSRCTAASRASSYDPCYHEACDNIDTVTGQPPADTMNVFEADPTPATCVAQQQADSLQRQRAEVAARDVRRRDARGLVLRATTRNALPPRATTAKAARKAGGPAAVQVPGPPARTHALRPTRRVMAEGAARPWPGPPSAASRQGLLQWSDRAWASGACRGPSPLPFFPVAVRMEPGACPCRLIAKVPGGVAPRRHPTTSRRSS